MAGGGYLVPILKISAFILYTGPKEGPRSPAPKEIPDNAHLDGPS